MDTKFLKQIPFFSHLSDANIEVILNVFEAKNFKKGEEVIRQGDPGDGMYVIIFGDVDIEINGEKVKTLGGNDFVGEMALIADEPRSATVRVTSDDLSTFFLSKEAFEKIKDELGSEVKTEILKRVSEDYGR